MSRFIVQNTWPFDYMDKQLGRLRQWFEGFQDGGGRLPHDFDVLRQCQVVLNGAKPLPTAHELRAAHREMEDAAARLEEAMMAASSAFNKFASAIEAAKAGETGTGSTEGESAAAKQDAQGGAA